MITLIFHCIIHFERSSYSLESFLLRSGLPLYLKSGKNGSLTFYAKKKSKKTWNLRSYEKNPGKN